MLFQRVSAFFNEITAGCRKGGHFFGSFFASSECPKCRGADLVAPLHLGRTYSQFPNTKNSANTHALCGEAVVGCNTVAFIAIVH